jgi:hypothetical protein
MKLIEKTFKTTHQQYRVLPASKHFIIAHEKTSLLRLHHAQMHFKIISWGTFPKETQASLKETLRNNPFFHRKYKGLRFRFFPQSNTFEVYSQEGGIFCNDEASGIAKLTQKVYQAVQHIVDKYNMKVSMGTISRKPHFSIVNNPFTKALTDYCDVKGESFETENFWVDKSLDTGEFETSTPFKAQQFINGVINWKEARDEINTKLDDTIRMIAKLTWNTEQLSEQIYKMRFGK